ncbi:MAG: hypothetical protein QM817_27015 [Archangium sp.]
MTIKTTLFGAALNQVKKAVTSSPPATPSIFTFSQPKPPKNIFGVDLFTPRFLSAPPPYVPTLTEHEKQWLSNLERAPEPTLGRKALDVLRETPGYKALSPDVQTRVLKIFLQQSAEIGPNAFYSQDNFESLLHLVKSPGFQKLAGYDQASVLNAFERCDHTGKQALSALADRTINGQPALATRDAGGSLATRLALLTYSKASRSFVNSVLGELNAPQNIGQAVNADTQALHRKLASQRPAELVRVLTELVNDQQVTLADGKTKLDPPRPTFPFDFTPIARQGSSESAALFQRAAFGRDARAFG